MFCVWQQTRAAPLMPSNVLQMYTHLIVLLSTHIACFVCLCRVLMTFSTYYILFNLSLRLSVVMYIFSFFFASEITTTERLHAFPSPTTAHTKSNTHFSTVRIRCMSRPYNRLSNEHECEKNEKKIFKNPQRVHIKRWAYTITT